MEHYVLGFVFNRNQDKVLLIRKEKPSWQAGRWNGIGGKIKDIDKSSLKAMERECEEEIGVPYDWQHCITFICPSGTVFVFQNIDYLTSLDKPDEIEFKQIENELLQVWSINNLPNNIMDNLKWLIPICLSTLQFPLVVHDLVKGGN